MTEAVPLEGGLEEESSDYNEEAPETMQLFRQYPYAARHLSNIGGPKQSKGPA